MEILGITHRNTLRRQGTDRSTLVRWKRNGLIRSVQPWYLRADAPEDVVAILSRGLRPTCLDAAALHGLFVPVHPGVHVFRPRTVHGRAEFAGLELTPIRRRGGLPPVEPPPREPIVLHGPELRSWPDDEPVPAIGVVLDHAARCLPVVKAAVLIESAVNRGVIAFADAQRLVAGLPRDLRRQLSRIRSDAESGTETVVRWWLESMGVRVRTQVPFQGGARRMDLLVGRSWVIECDSRAHHDDPRSYVEDRERDLHLTSRGYYVTRLTWEQVFLRWDETEAMLLAILRSGHHRRAPMPGRT